MRIPRSLPHPIGQDDLDTAIACAPDRIRPWLILAAFAGLRVGEIAGLQRQHVREHGDPPVLHIYGKGGHERIVPMSDRVRLELLAAGLPTRGHVFTRHDGKGGANRPHTVSRLVNDYLHELGISETAHSLRHYFGSAVYRATPDLRVCQELMGHTNPSTTAGYVAWSSAKALLAVQALPGARLREHVASGG